MKYIYYPGCSMQSSAKSYEESLIAVFKTLDIPIEELKYWNCCGATSYMSVDEMKAFALAARNLALAEHQNGSADVDVIAPCSACYLVLMKTQRYLKDRPEIHSRVQKGLQSIGLSYKGNANVRHPLDVLVNDIGISQLKNAVKKPLKNLKVASYYGCQAVRPFQVFDDPRDPQTMDRIVEAMGASAVDWSLKTRCCGGTLTSTINEVGIRLNYIILKEAEKRGADVIVTACPLCQFNLECFRDEMKTMYNDAIKIPVIYFTQLMGMAFGINENILGIQRTLIQPMCVSKMTRGEIYV